jgi:hypothetical protein
MNSENHDGYEGHEGLLRVGCRFLLCALRALRGGKTHFMKISFLRILSPALFAVLTSLFLRQQFVLPDTNNVRGLWLGAWLDDGLAIFINGQPARSPLSVLGALTYTNKAMISREGRTQIPLDLSSALGLLRAGTNVLCLQAYNRSLTDDDFRIDVELGETPATFALANAAYTVSEIDGQVVVRVIGTGVMDAVATVDYATSDGTATAGQDYGETKGTLSFAPGELVKSLKIPITEDRLIESDEDFTITLSNPSGTAFLGCLRAV